MGTTGSLAPWLRVENIIFTSACGAERDLEGVFQVRSQDTGFTTAAPSVGPPCVFVMELSMLSSELRDPGDLHSMKPDLDSATG